MKLTMFAVTGLAATGLSFGGAAFASAASAATDPGPGPQTGPGHNAPATPGHDTPTTPGHDTPTTPGHETPTDHWYDPPGGKQTTPGRPGKDSSTDWREPASGVPGHGPDDTESGYHHLWWPTLKKGHRNENVRALQWLLTCHGYKVPATSYFGDKTSTAVRGYQHANRITADGSVGRYTWINLTDHRDRFSYGRTNDCVKGLQVALNKWKFDDDLPITGYFGPRTKTKLIKFQKYYGLPVHGHYADLTDWSTLTSKLPAKHHG